MKQTSTHFSEHKEAFGNSELFNKTDNENKSILLEQYKLYIETANGTTSSRLQANTFFLTINTTLVGFMVGVIEFSQTSTLERWIVFTCGVGVMLCLSWLQVIRVYSHLNYARFKIIQEIEKQLPANIYVYEKKITDERRSQYWLFRQTFIEFTVPLLFIALYILLIAALLATTP